MNPYDSKLETRKHKYVSLVSGAEVHPEDCDHRETETVDTAVGELERCKSCKQLQ